MCMADFIDTPVASNAGRNIDTHFAVVTCQQPEFASKVEVAQYINGVFPISTFVSGSYQSFEGIAGRFVTIFFSSAETFAHYGKNCDSGFGFNLLAYGFHIVAYHAHNAGRIDKSSFGLIGFDEFD